MVMGGCDYICVAMGGYVWLCVAMGSQVWLFVDTVLCKRNANEIC